MFSVWTHLKIFPGLKIKEEFNPKCWLRLILLIWGAKVGVVIFSFDEAILNIQQCIIERLTVDIDVSSIYGMTVYACDRRYTLHSSSQAAEENNRRLSNTDIFTVSLTATSVTHRPDHITRKRALNCAINLVLFLHSQTHIIIIICWFIWRCKTWKQTSGRILEKCSA